MRKSIKNYGDQHPASCLCYLNVYRGVHCGILQYALRKYYTFILIEWSNELIKHQKSFKNSIFSGSYRFFLQFNTYQSKALFKK